MLRINGLKKSFGEKEVLKGLDLVVPEHSIYGFCGRNGAGKTTTMKIVLGLLAADDGEVLVSGEKVHFGDTPTNRYIGYLPDVPEFYSYMNAMEYLRFCGQITGLSPKETDTRSEELLDKVGLGKEKHRIKGYSRGMKQRLGIAQALLGRPKLLICDEPTSALDPVGRKEILDILSSVKDETTVLFSTHILSDVERICTDIAFLSEGTIKLSGKKEEIREENRTSRYYVNHTGMTSEALEKMVKRFGDAVSSYDSNSKDLINEKNEASREFIFDTTKGDYTEFIYFIADHKIKVNKMELIEPSLEDIFLEVTGE
ncbi:ABC-2 type transport system ATP-binding protein [Eubacterium ruminantium]|nr:ABC-2 type transport system ATP-binding protein [Eubacterium ruminantium]